MGFEGVSINKINGGLGGAENPDRVAVMVLGCGTIADTLEVHTAYKLLQLSDAEALGITPEHDDAESRLDHYQLSEVFRLSPDTVISLIAVPAATKVSDLKNSAAFITALRSIEGVNLIAIDGNRRLYQKRDGYRDMCHTLRCGDNSGKYNLMF